MLFAPLVWLWQWAVGPYHVEMVWDVMEGGYKAFSLQPPTLSIVERRFADVKIRVFRLRELPEIMSVLFWMWGNKWLTHPEFYVLGVQTCGHPVVEFYKLDCSPYPASIEKFCRKSEEFIQIV